MVNNGYWWSGFGNYSSRVTWISPNGPSATTGYRGAAANVHLIIFTVFSSHLSNIWSIYRWPYGLCSFSDMTDLWGMGWMLGKSYQTILICLEPELVTTFHPWPIINKWKYGLQGPFCQFDSLLQKGLLKRMEHRILIWCKSCGDHRTI